MEDKSFETIVSIGSIDNENLFELISEGAWREVLTSLTKDMDPWDVDLFKLNDRLSDHIQKMRYMDLTVPSKILLAAAIIYRLKSETLSYTGVDAALEDAFEDDFLSGFDEDTPLMTVGDDKKIILPNIQLPIRRQPKRRVTLDELIDALGGAMKVKHRREAKHFFQVELNGQDISASIEELYGKINEFLSQTQGGGVVFSQLLGNKSGSEDTLRKFSSLLHLSNEERIRCIQDELFGDIKIHKL
ncbi:MAG: hypothetical protein KAI53_04885 [Candidatus Aenigmarchaeota archaeon]|nr:hypothetical protein [Candidatus Aenigmarchaeota archaeon]